MFDFHWPWIFLLIPAPLLIAALTARHDHPGIPVAPRLEHSVKSLNQGGSLLLRGRFWRLLLQWIIWLCLLTAIAQPIRPESTELQAATGRSLVIAADLSESMSKTDFTMQDVAVNRLDVVKAIAGQFIAGRAGDRIGLVLFGDEAFIGSPLSFDLRSVNEVLQSSGIGMAGKSTAIGDALGLAIRVLRDESADEKAIILLSDGTNLSGTAEPEDAAALAAELGIRVHTIGLGSDDSVSAGQLYLSSSADLDEETLVAVAKSSGGEFFRARTSAELTEIYRAIDQLESTDEVAPPVIIQQDYRNGFILAMLIGTLLLFIGRVFSR